MDLIDALRSIDKPHEDDVLNRLFTPWGENLDKDHVLSEYPRPQFVRDSYINLNGYWDYCIKDKPEGYNDSAADKRLDTDIPASMDGRRFADHAAGYIHPCSTWALSDLELEIFP